MENKGLNKEVEKREKLQAPRVNISKPIDMEIVGDKGWTMQRMQKKIQRNQPCTCGSGKKAKKCCYVEY